jgi:hypothetical protein
VLIRGASIQVNPSRIERWSFPKSGAIMNCGQTKSPGLDALSLVNHLAMRTITATRQQPQINMPVRDKKHSFFEEFRAYRSRNAQFCCGIEQAGTVHVDGQAHRTPHIPHRPRF